LRGFTSQIVFRESRSADQQGDQARQGGDDAGGGFGRVLENALDHLGAVVADQTADLSHHLVHGRLVAEDQARHADGDDQQGGDGEDGVVGHGRREARSPIARPFGVGFQDQIPDQFQKRHAMPPAGSQGTPDVKLNMPTGPARKIAGK
jgi:hypothetical protein